MGGGGFKGLRIIFGGPNLFLEECYVHNIITNLIQQLVIGKFKINVNVGPKLKSITTYYIGFVVKSL